MILWLWIGLFWEPTLWRLIVLLQTPLDTNLETFVISPTVPMPVLELVI